MSNDKPESGLRRTRLENESSEYLAKREELRHAEIDSMWQRERVAQLRRELPSGAIVEDYAFLEGPADLNAGDGPARTVRLSELFSGRNRSVVIYQFMYGKLQTKPCPMCTLLIDGLNGVAHHLAQNVDVAISAAAELPALRSHARRQGWHRLRLLSTPAGSTFKYDLGGEDREGHQDSTISVFTRDPDGTLRHFYSAHPRMGPDIKERGLDLLTPVYNVLDLLPQGRGNWYATLDYEPDVFAKPAIGNASDLVCRLFSAFEKKDRKMCEDLLSDDFTFSSPRDNHINKAAYFQRCWPNSEKFRTIQIEEIYTKGSDAFVRYHAELKDGSRFRNTEFIRTDGSKIKQVDVYFGRSLSESDIKKDIPA